MWDYIVCALKEFVQFLFDVLVAWWMDWLTKLIAIILPQNVFNFERIEWGAFGNFVGYFIPVAKMVTHLTVILAAVAIYYSWQHIMRLLKMVR